MKAKISRGAGFRGLLDYLYGPGEGHYPGRAVQVVGAGNVLGSEPRELAREFAIARQIRADIKRPVWHCSLSLAPGEKLPDERWAEIARDFLIHMGLNPDARQWHCARHIDTDHDHIHLVVSRVALDASVWHGKNDVRLAIQVTQEMEKEHGLKLTPGFDEGGEQKSLTKAEVGRYRRTGKVPDRLILQKKIEAARQNCPDFATFASRCRHEQVEIIPNGKSGQVGGISFRLRGGDPFSGSSLGKAYTWQRIAADTHFDSEKDAELIAQLRENAVKAEVAGNIGTAGSETIAVTEIHRARGQIDHGKERDRYFVRQEDGGWCWKNRAERAAFRLEGEQITVLSWRDVAIRAALLTAAESFGSPLLVQGADEFRRQVWLAGSKMGLEVMGHNPTSKDLAELASWREKHGGPVIEQNSIVSAPGPAENNELQPGYTLPPQEETSHEHASRHGERDRDPELAAGTGNNTSEGRGDTAYSGAEGRDIAVTAVTDTANGTRDSGSDQATMQPASANQSHGIADPAKEPANCKAGEGIGRHEPRPKEPPCPTPAIAEKSASATAQTTVIQQPTKREEKSKMMMEEMQAREWIEKLAQKYDVSKVQFSAVAHTDSGYKLLDAAPRAICAQVRVQLRDLYGEHRKAMHKEIDKKWTWLQAPTACYEKCLQEKHGENMAKLADEKKASLNRLAGLKQQAAALAEQQETLAFWQKGKREKIAQDIAEVKEQGRKEAMRLQEIEQELEGLKITAKEVRDFASKAKRQEKLEHLWLDDTIDNRIRRADPEERKKDRDVKEKSLAEQQERERQAREVEERLAREKARAEEERRRESQRRAVEKAKKKNSAPSPT